ncbi:MAG: type I polyketide synthase, partial [Planctomycetota bacterium]|nr:type I polyketide synthase [Planctomycetota bacterium]
MDALGALLRSSQDVHVSSVGVALVSPFAGRRFESRDGIFQSVVEMPSGLSPVSESKRLAEVEPMHSEYDLPAVRAVVERSVVNVVGDEVASDEPLMAAGMDSLGAVELRSLLQSGLGIKLPSTVVFDYPSVDALVSYIASRVCVDACVAPAADTLAAAVADGGSRSERTCSIVSWTHTLPRSVGFSGSADAISLVPSSRWAVDDVDSLRGLSSMTARFGGFVEGAERFDCGAFGISHKEAVMMDPQYRLLMLGVFESIVAGRRVTDVSSSVLLDAGVCVGIQQHEYGSLLRGAYGLDSPGYQATGNALSVASGRLAYTFGLQGPTMSVDTACSSALVAVHAARSGLSNAESQSSFACGVQLNLSADLYCILTAAGMLTADGRCKVLDSRADGYVRGEACATCLLRRGRVDSHSSAAVLICGSSVNQDGRSSSLTAPNGPAQQAVMLRASRDAGVPS